MAPFCDFQGFISKHPATFPAQGYWYFYVTCFLTLFLASFLIFGPKDPPPLDIWFSYLEGGGGIVPGLFEMCRDCLKSTFTTVPAQ
jgi:hypothetical protein